MGWPSGRDESKKFQGEGKNRSGKVRSFERDLWDHSDANKELYADPVRSNREAVVSNRWHQFISS
jgi:hypothetical protein